jgi:hypothetical protein
MSKLMMLAGGIVEQGGGLPGMASAYVVLSAGRKSRLFKVHGPVDALRVDELPAATTIDLQRFQRELESDLMPLLLGARAVGGAAAMATPSEESIFDAVRGHLKTHEGFEIN